MKKDVVLYKITRPIITAFSKVFLRPNIIGDAYIPSNGGVVLAGTHTHIMDSVLLISTTKRNIHFLAKQELWKGIKGLFFKHMGLIPVKRDNKDHEALMEAIHYLDNGLVIGIFPEGTTEKGKELLPFKMGAVKMAKESNVPIVPFVIKGKYRLFSKDLSIEFLPPINIKGELDEENKRLRDLIAKKKGDIN